MSNDRRSNVELLHGADDSAPTRVSAIQLHDLADWSSLDDDDARVEIGSVVRERFELESRLGEGGMGVVYRAVDRLHKEMEDRDPYVAIKILNAKFKRHPHALIALQRETRKAQTLAHENIINVHSFDRDGSIVYMTMELLDGKSLRSIVAEHASSGLPPRDVVPMIRGMAKALAYAHENDIVHSDFKPANVFLTSKKQIKVLDFGVARAAPVAADAEADQVADVLDVGGMTPAYASPQMLGGGDPTPSDDVFALAIVSHELLTGRHPFDYRAADDARLAALKSVSLPGLSRSQKKALHRAFAADPDSRQKNAGEFLREFDRSSSRKTVALASLAGGVALPVAAFFVATPNFRATPAIAFEDLAPEVQRQFESAVGEGHTALTFGNAAINDALAYFSRAYELHPHNERAVRGLEEVADRFLASIRSADAGTQADAFGLLYCNDYLSGYAPVAATCSDVLGAAQCASLAERCKAAPAD